jgi:hypothetical protein
MAHLLVVLEPFAAHMAKATSAIASGVCSRRIVKPGVNHMIAYSKEDLINAMVFFGTTM